MAFRRNLRPICQLVRRSFVGKDSTISMLCIINIFLFIEPTSRHKKPCSMFMFGEQGHKFQKGWLMIVKHNFNWSVFYFPNWLDSTLNLPVVFLIYRNLWNKNKTCDFCEQHQVTWTRSARASAVFIRFIRFIKIHQIHKIGWSYFRSYTVNDFSLSDNFRSHVFILGLKGVVGVCRGCESNKQASKYYSVRRGVSS